MPRLFSASPISVMTASCDYAFSKHFRNIHIITQYGFINAGKLQSVGQIMLGLEPE